MVTGPRIVTIGAIAAIIGCFLPFLHMPIVGSITYFGNGKFDGVWVCVASAIALIAAAGFRNAAVGVLSGVVVVYMLIRVQSVFSQATAAMDRAVAGAGMFGGLISLLGAQVYLEIGFYVVAAGAVLMLFGGLLSLFWRPRTSPASTPSTEPIV